MCFSCWPLQEPLCRLEYQRFKSKKLAAYRVLLALKSSLGYVKKIYCEPNSETCLAVQFHLAPGSTFHIALLLLNRAWRQLVAAFFSWNTVAIYNVLLIRICRQNSVSFGWKVVCRRWIALACIQSITRYSSTAWLQAMLKITWSFVAQFSVVRLVPHSCDKIQVADLMKTGSSLVCKLDGLLFYHEDGLYITGVTPLVCWLKPFMVSEILKMAVPDRFLIDMPSDYRSVREYVAAADLKRMENKRSRVTLNLM